MTRRSNDQRSLETRTALMDAARELFVERSYAETNTPEVVIQAGVTRGALYHHFEDKRDLFRAVVEREAERVASEIEASTPEASTAIRALELGGVAFLKAMTVPGRTRLLLTDGPAVLGREEMDLIDARHGNRTLSEGLRAAMASGEIRKIPVEPLTQLLGAMFDRAALAIESGQDQRVYVRTVNAVLRGLGADPKA
jgi:AcrR family transcriptional regulator